MSKSPIREMVTPAQVQARVAELGAQISADYAGQSLLMVAVLRGGVYFAVDISRFITVPLAVDFIEISTYGAVSDARGVVRITKDLEEPITDRHVMLIEDIVDTGLSLSYLLQVLKTRQPASLRTCTLVDAPQRRLVSVPVDYSGFTLHEENLVGCGLDYKQEWRNYPGLAVFYPEHD